MARKTHSLKKLPWPQTFLFYIGLPFYKLLGYLLIIVLFLSSFFKRTSNKTRFNRINQKILISVFLVSLFVSSFVSYFQITSFFHSLPDVSTLPTYKNVASTKLYSSNGQLLYKFYDEINRTPLTLNEIPLSVRLATIAKEDKHFYSHKGISIPDMIRAFADYVKTGRITGASTITQQLVKNVYLSPERTFTRKIKEIILALEVDHMYSKDQILEYYLNRIPYGGTSYGIEEASHSYFGKNAKDLSLSQSAFLASRPQNPSINLNDPQIAESSRNTVLLQMNKLGFITDNELHEAETDRLTFSQDTLFSTAPHFVMFAGQLLQNRFGPAVWTGGFSVYSTLHPEIQRMAEEVVTNELTKIKTLHVTNAGALVLSVKTGEILAMVGSKNYNDVKNDGNVNTTLSLRQPGSSIKVVNYAYALSHGFTPASIIDDSPTVFPIKGGPPYKPVNYDGRFVGKISLRDALAQSRNIPAVKLLATYGVSHMIDMGRAMGISSWNESRASRFGLSLTLGGGEITLMDLAHVYLTIANYGKRIPLVALSKVINNNNEEQMSCIEEDCSSEAVISPEVAYQLISILSDNTARSPEFGLHSALVIPGHPEVAVKTGTSNNLKDNLTVGFNQDYLVAVWVGNNDGTPMSRVASGVTGASPIWQSIMMHLLKDVPSIAWNVPSNLVEAKSCRGKPEWFIKGTEPKNNCIINTTNQVATIH